MSVDLSIVTTLYGSAEYLPRFHRRMRAAAKAAGYGHLEMIYVNDASPDESRDIALLLQREDSSVVVIDLARNTGHHRAIMVGLAHARGDSVFLIDCDLEEPPELLIPMAARRREESSLDVVYGVPRRRRGGWLERWAGRLFYRMLSWAADFDVPVDAATVRLMDRHYVNALLRFRERVLMIGGVFALAGFRQESLLFDKASSSTTTYDFGRRVGQAVTALTSFSDKPLRAFLGVGLGITLIAAIVGTWTITMRLVGTTPTHGYASLMVSVWGLGGLMLLTIGILGTSLARVYRAVKRRPLWIERPRGPVGDASEGVLR